MTHSKPIHLLYMDDDLGLARLLKKRLERQGFIVDIASNGEEGLRMYDPIFHDVIAVDQEMPGLEGLEVIKKLTITSAAPPIVMITGTGDERVAVEAMKLGARDYIIKDVEGTYLDLMPAVIRQVMFQQRLIEDKRRAEHTLRQSEERYRSLVELSPDGIVVYQIGTFVYANQAMFRLLGTAETDTLSMQIVRAAIHPSYFESISSELPRALAQGRKSTLLEAQLIRVDQSIIDVEIMAAPISFQGNDALQIIVRDVTERKRAEETRREAERLRTALDKERELSDLKTRLMITISHEFRTPLAIVNSSAELLEKFLDRMEPEKRKGHLHKIQAQIHKLTEMMEDITLIIQATFDRVVPHFEPTDFAKLCEDSRRQIQVLVEVPERIILKIEDNLPPLMLDQRRMKYVITNLLSNAHKYSPPETNITLEAFQQDQLVIVRVTDQGIGIPIAEQSHIFEPFYRAQNVGMIGGTGLGLSIVKDIIELHGGVLDLQSEVGKGTQVSIYLPIRSAPDMNASMEEQSAAQ